MNKITLHLDDELAERAKLAASEAGVSQSRWIAKLIEEKLATEWSESVKQLVGSWPADFPEAEDIRST
ncbi:MAG: DUF6364 family protein [Deinococcota bacterium]